MIFLTITDFDKQIRADQLQRIIDDGSGILDDAELAAIAEMTSYLVSKYNVSLIFSVSGRNSLVVMYCVDILLYHVHSRISPSTIPEMRIVRYENAISWLKAVAKGDIVADLPRIEETKPKFLFQSDTKQDWAF